MERVSFPNYSFVVIGVFASVLEWCDRSAEGKRSIPLFFYRVYLNVSCLSKLG
jgi:hypothetical protein